MKRLTLSFDNGPWPDATDAVLDILRERALGAAFFFVGERLRDAAAFSAAARAGAAGHRLGSHTLSHRTPLGLCTAEEAIAEIAGGEAALGPLGDPAKLFRPQGKGLLGPHLLNRAAADLLIAGGYTVVTWNNVPRDWEDENGDWVDRAHAALAKQDWSLLVLHDGHLARMPGTLERFLDGLADVEIVQDFPPDCVILDRGRPQPGFEAAITG